MSVIAPLSRRCLLGAAGAWAAMASVARPQTSSDTNAVARDAYMRLWPLAEAGNFVAVERLIQEHALAELPMANVALALAYIAGGQPRRATELAGLLDVRDVGERKVQIYAGAAARYARAGGWIEAERAAADASTAADEIIGGGLDAAVAAEALEQLSPAAQLRTFIAIRNGVPLQAFSHAEVARARLLSFILEDNALPPANRAAIAHWRRERAIAQTQLRISVIDSAIARERAIGRAAVRIEKPLRSTRAAAAVLAVASSAGGGLCVVTLDAQARAMGVEVQGVVELPRLFESNPRAGQRSFKRALTARRARGDRNRDMVWLRDLNGLADALWARIGADLCAALEGAGVSPGARVVWLPTAKLGLLPLAIARNPETGRCLVDDYEFVQAPSWAVYSQAEARATTDVRPVTIAGAFNPTGDLTFAAIEGEMIGAFAGARLVERAGVGSHAAAAFERISKSSVWHFATHAAFDLQDARNAAIYFAPDASGQFTTLTIGAILDAGLDIGPRLVFLSACESGLAEVARTPEEFVGLPSAFLQAGAAAVIATLWKVDDLPTALISARFYELWLRDGNDPPTALHGAQQWLRGAHSAALRDYVAQFSLTAGRREAVQEALMQYSDHERPFSHPHYWGAFIYVGA